MGGENAASFSISYRQKEFIWKGADMNKGTRIRTALAIATSVNMALATIDVAEFGNEKATMAYKVISVLVNAVVVGLVAYYNNDYTVEGETGTKITREMKELRDHIPLTTEEPEDSFIVEEESEVDNGEE